MARPASWRLTLRVVRCLPSTAGTTTRAGTIGQALDKPRWRKPRGAKIGVRGDTAMLWGFECALGCWKVTTPVLMQSDSFWRQP